MHVLEAEDPVGELGHGFNVPVQCRGVQEDAPRRGLLHGLGNVARHIPGPFVELGVVQLEAHHEGRSQFPLKLSAMTMIIILDSKIIKGEDNEENRWKWQSFSTDSAHIGFDDNMPNGRGSKDRG
jgi:hypothetical protein